MYEYMYCTLIFYNIINKISHNERTIDSRDAVAPCKKEKEKSMSAL